MKTAWGPRKFIIINAIIALICLVPFVYGSMGTHTCVVANRDQPNTQRWEGTHEMIKFASREALKKCEFENLKPEKCFILSCEKSLFHLE